MMRKLTPRLTKKRRMRLELLTDILIQIIYTYISNHLVMTVLKGKIIYIYISKHLVMTVLNGIFTDLTDFRKCA
jgi:hypothetical protein